jgi:outer membrane protein
MIMRIGSLPVVVLVASLGLIVWPANSAARSLTMKQAVQLALSHSKTVKKAEQQLVELEAIRKSTRGAFLPQLKVEANVLVWDKALPFEIDVPGLPLPDLGNIRDQLTAQASITLTQPLTPLWQIAEGYSAVKHSKRAVRKVVEKNRIDVAADARKAYIQLKQAEAGVRIAKAAVAQVEAQLQTVKALKTAGLAGRNDVLKVEVGLARAKGAVIQTEAGSELAQAALAITLGVAADEKLGATDSFGEPPATTARFGSFLAQALERRPMLAAVRAQQQAAQAQTRAAKAALVPNVAAFATYQRTEGQGFAFPKNAFFAGGALSWSFDWGQHYYKIDAAKAKARSAGLDEKQLKDGIFLQVKQAFLALRTARQQLTIARAAVKQSEEAYRLEKVKYEKGAATTTDMLSAQLTLNRSRLTESNALFGWHIARSELDRATAVTPNNEGK